MATADSVISGKTANLRDVNGFVFVCVLVFAMASWINFHFVWVELPIFVATLPENWSLPSYLMVTIVLGYIGPCLYMLSKKLCITIDPKRMETVAGMILIGIELFVTFLLIFFWDRTAYVLGAHRSVALILMFFILSMAASSSYLVFCPFMTRLPSYYMAAYLAGEGVGGLLGGCVGLIQGVSEDVTCLNQTEHVLNAVSGKNISISTLVQVPPTPRFSVSVFFGVLLVALGASLVGFLLLNYSSTGKREMLSDDNNQSTQSEMAAYDDPASVVIQNMTVKKPSKLRLSLMIIVFGYTEISMYGIWGSLLPYAALPYGSMAYTLALRIGSVASPLSALSTYIVPARSLIALGITTATSVMISIYMMYLAVHSPNPPLLDRPEIGTAVVVISYVSLCILETYGRAAAGMMLHQEAGHKGVTLAGIISLMFYSISTMVSFVLINVLHVFQHKEPCLDTSHEPSASLDA